MNLRSQWKALAQRLLGKRETTAIADLAEKKEIAGRKATLERKAREAIEATLARRDHKAFLARRDRRVYQEYQDLKDPMVSKGFLAFLGRKVRRAIRDRPDR